MDQSEIGKKIPKQYHPYNPIFQALIFGRFQILLGLAEIFIKSEKGKEYENKIKRATTALVLVAVSSIQQAPIVHSIIILYLVPLPTYCITK